MNDSPLHEGEGDSPDWCDKKDSNDGDSFNNDEENKLIEFTVEMVNLQSTGHSSMMYISLCIYITIHSLTLAIHLC